MNKFWRFLAACHRYIGLFSALILIMLAVTGIALNHTEELALDSQMIQSNTLLDWYDIKNPQQITAFATQNHWVTQLDNSLYFNQQRLQANSELMGVIETPDFIVIALANTLLLLSLEGEIIEQLPFNTLKKIGQHQQHLIIQTEHKILSSNNQLLSWNPYQGKTIQWSKPSELPLKKQQQLAHQYRSAIIPLERLILDLHSGRFFGKTGVILVDLSGIGLIILTFSGLFIWFRKLIRQKTKRPKNN